MRSSSRFSIALHILLAIDTFADDYKVTSEFLATSVNVNPVIIRKTLGQLKEAGLVEITRGTGGARLARDKGKITLLDVFWAVERADEGLFGFHEHPNPDCPVGRNVHTVLDGYFDRAQDALLRELAQVTLQDAARSLSALLA